MDRKNVLRKITKLLALAGNNPNEHEATTALLQARKLMQKFDIEEREIEGHSENPNANIKEELGHKKGYEKWEMYLASAMRNLLPVEMICKADYKGRRRPAFLGHPADVDVTLHMYEYIRKTIGRLGRKQPSHTATRSFCIGAVISVNQRFNDMRREEEKKAHENKNGVEATYALICIDKEKQIANFIEDTYPDLTQTRQRNSNVDANAYYTGREAGRNINLNKHLKGA